MRPRIKSHLQAWRRQIGIAIFLAGGAAGSIVYFTASSPAPDILAEQAAQSKQYQREMETYGGAANELASQFREWFDGLWQGPTLGITIACLSALLAGIVFLALTPIPGPLDRDEGPPDRDR